MSEVKDSVSPREVEGADYIFEEESEISTIGGPVTRGVIGDKLHAKRHFEPGAKKQKVAGGLKWWRSLNQVRLKGSKTEIDFEAGRLFGANPVEIGAPLTLRTPFKDTPPERRYVNNQYATKDN